MFGNSMLDLVEEVTKLHTDNDGCHAQQNVTPEEHVDVMQKVNSEHY